MQQNHFIWKQIYGTVSLHHRYAEQERKRDWLKGKYINYANLLYLQNNKISHTRRTKKKQQHSNKCTSRDTTRDREIWFSAFERAQSHTDAPYRNIIYIIGMSNKWEMQCCYKINYHMSRLFIISKFQCCFILSEVGAPQSHQHEPTQGNQRHSMKFWRRRIMTQYTPIPIFIDCWTISDFFKSLILRIKFEVNITETLKIWSFF